MPDMKQIEEELEQKANQVKMLIRDGHVPKALQMIDDLEQQAAPYLDELPPRISYLIPFSRGRAYLQIKQPTLALAELEKATKLAGPDIEAVARSQNLIGVVLYEQEQPSLAVRYHLECVHAIVNGPIRDLNFRLSVYQNLANAYWALHDVPQAIFAYKEALRVLKDLDAPERQADVFWGLALAYKAQSMWRYAKMYIRRAIQAYQATNNRAAEAAMHINLAEILLAEGHTREAANSLDRASKLLSGTDHQGLLSFTHHYYAKIALKMGDLDGAQQHAEGSVKYAETLLHSDQTEDSHVWVDPIRTYAEALHGTALVEEAKGNWQAADLLFEKAFEHLKRTTLREIKNALHLSYATVLQDRGDYKRAVEHYRAANEPEEEEEGPAR